MAMKFGLNVLGLFIFSAFISHIDCQNETKQNSLPYFPNPYPIPPKCSECNKLALGFGMAQDKFSNVDTLIQSLLTFDFCPKPKTRQLNLVSTIAVDALTPVQVTCPSGYSLLHCRCSVEASCLGAALKDSSTCEVTGPYNRAMALCIHNDESTFIALPVQSAFSPIPVLSCGTGRIMVDCFVVQSVSPMNSFKIRTKIVSNACTTTSMCPGTGCKLSAVCVPVVQFS